MYKSIVSREADYIRTLTDPRTDPGCANDAAKISYLSIYRPLASCSSVHFANIPIYTQSLFTRLHDREPSFNGIGRTPESSTAIHVQDSYTVD